MGMQEAVRSVFNNYATFAGRARRAEYWWFVLFTLIVGAILSGLDGALFGYKVTTSTVDGYSFDYRSFGVLAPLWSLATFIPMLAVHVRRLHDTGKSGWMLLLWLIPAIGAIVIFVFMVLRGNPGTNTYGPDPVGATD